MENLRLKESLAELRGFVEEGGEREQLLGEVAALRDQTLELLEKEKSNGQLQAMAERAAEVSQARIEEAAALAQSEALKHEELKKVRSQRGHQPNTSGSDVDTHLLCSPALFQRLVSEKARNGRIGESG